MRYQSILFCVFILLTAHLSFAQERNIPIGKEEGGKFVFTFDTTQLKEYFQGFLPDSFAVEKPFFDKISIEKATLANNGSAGLNSNPYYFLLLRNYKHKLKLALTLRKKGNELLLFANTPEMTANEVELASSYIICYGTDENCFPQLHINTDQKVIWAASPGSTTSLPYLDCMQVSGLLKFKK